MMRAFPVTGDDFGDYRIERELGRGAMGIVYLARQRRPARLVALKLLNPDLDQPAFRKRFEREAETLARLHSAYVVTLLEYGEQDGWLYMTNQYLPVGDLHQLINTHPPGPDAALRLFGQLATGLAAAHQLGIVHRDIKPANILLAEEADGLRALLADFGIARDQQHPSTLTGGGIIGTLPYMPPERFLGAPATPAGDVYALGCVLWAMLHKWPLFVDRAGILNTSHLLNGTRAAYIGPKAAQINTILDRCLAVDITERHPNAGALLVALRDLERPPPRPRWPHPDNEPGTAPPGRIRVPAPPTQTGPPPRPTPPTEPAPPPRPAPPQKTTPPGPGKARTTAKVPPPGRGENGQRTPLPDVGRQRPERGKHRKTLAVVLAAAVAALVAIPILIAASDSPSTSAPDSAVDTDAGNNPATNTPPTSDLPTTDPFEDDPFDQPYENDPFAMGSCHNLTQAQLSRDSAPKQQVPCLTEHTTYTVDVLPVSVADQALGQFGDPATDCWRASMRILGGGPDAIAASALQATYFLPTPAQKRNGEYWVRCDVYLWSGGKLATLPDSLGVGALRNGPDRTVAECARTDGTLVVCTEPHAFEVIATPRVTKQAYAAAAEASPRSLAGLPFPKQAVVDRLVEVCPSGTEWYHPIDQTVWEDGHPFLVCLG